ncbi:winged helix-turn-helix transcriptional regulator [Streptomyces sp. NPDC001388]|uniref:ParB/RepB/Spo0J family partition protein n=1 Tax=unclassified Streptomyces TaxID=2593676 RepID=UPI0036B2E09E
MELIAIDELVTVGSPRISGEDPAYVQSLAESESELPPIMVHRRTMRVIDGTHRLRAAELRGQKQVAVLFFEGEESDAFVVSVAANVTHGLPLSREDRIAAVRHIFVSHPHWSDRAVATVTGLSAKKVAEVRRGMDEGAAAPAVRVGLDGRVRPVNSAHGRELASRLIRENPEASLREIARQVGISPATVADVRERLRQGRDPVPLKLRGGQSQTERLPRSLADNTVPLLRSRPLSDLTPIFDTLRRDPSMRFNDVGRMVLRLFDTCALAAREQQKIADTVPHHCRGLVAELLVGYAEVWRYLAEDLKDSDGFPHSPAV